MGGAGGSDSPKGGNQLMARSKRAALCAVAAVSAVAAFAGPAQAFDGSGTFTFSAPFTYAGGSDLGLNLLNATACGNDSPGVQRCDAFVLTAGSTGPALFSLDVPDAVFATPEIPELGTLALGPDFDMFVYKGA